MGFKNAARKLCPPLLWDGIKQVSGRGLSAVPAHPGAVIGENSLVEARIERRENGKGTVVIGRDCVIYGLLVTERDSAVIRIADKSFVNHFSIFDCATSITIEEDVMISYHCVVSDTNNHSTAYSVRKDDLQKWREGRYDWSVVKCAPVHICKGAWIGAYSIILKGVRVGIGSIVAAGSVVTKDVPDWTIVAGNPARIVRRIPEDQR